MSFFDTLKSLFSSNAGASDPMILWLHVRCQRCGAPLAVRVDLRNEPSPDYEQGGYVLFKEMMDDRCFALMRAEVHLDAQHHVTGQKIENGEFISPDEYARLTAEPSTIT